MGRTVWAIEERRSKNHKIIRKQKMKSCLIFICLGQFVFGEVIEPYHRPAHPKLQPGPWLKEVELKTATSDHAEMWALVVGTFKYGQLKRCRNFEIGDLKSVRVDHYGDDGWQGEYVKLFTDSGPDYYCPITKFLDNSDHENLSCKRL